MNRIREQLRTEEADFAKFLFKAILGGMGIIGCAVIGWSIGTEAGMAARELHSATIPAATVIESDSDVIRAAQRVCLRSGGTFGIQQAQGGWSVACHTTKEVSDE